VNDWVCGNCKSINRGSADACYSCGGDRAVVAASTDAVAAENVIAAEHPPAGAASSIAEPAPAGGSAGFAALNRQGALAGGPTAHPGATGLIGESPVDHGPAPTAPAGPATRADLIGGLAAGLVAAIVASAIWYAVVVVTGFQVGLVAIAVGFLVGQAVVLGARRRGSVVLVGASVVFTLLALAISEYLIVVHFVGLEFAADGLTIEVLQPIDFMIEVGAESVQADPLTLLFWAIALFQAVAIPARLLRGSAENRAD
jgi:hypothetical protein